MNSNNKKVNQKKTMAKSKFSLVFLLLVISSTPVISFIEVTDGGYSGIVVKISDEVPEDACEDILKRIQVRPLTFIFSKV